MKKAQDFLIDSALGEKSFEIKTPEQEEKTVLTIEEGGLPSASNTEEREQKKKTSTKNFFARTSEALKSIGKPKAKDKATFFRLLSIMINAGIPLIRSLDTIAEQTVNHRLKVTMYELARDIEKGGTLSSGMGRYPGIFSEAHIGMIKSGEASGQLNQILKQLAIEVEKSASMARKVKGAMMYPMFIVIIMVGVISGMMIMVVPKIAEIFTQSGKQLPLVTRIVIGMSNFMRDRWPLLFGGIIGAVIAFVAIRNTRQGKYATDWLFIKMPLFGSLIQKSILARFSRSLGNLLNSGVPIIQGLIINARGLGNEVYRKRVELASEDIARGIQLGESLRDCPEFPTMMVQMISVGEQTAQLDIIAGKIAEYYEDEVDVAVASLSKVIEPVILVIVGVSVGTIVGAVMMPIIQLTSLSGAL